MGALQTYTPFELKVTPALQRALKPVDDPTAVEVVMADGRSIRLPQELASALLAAVMQAAEGHDLAIMSSDDEVTPARAGKLLGLSRQYVDRLIAEGVLPARRLPGSTHRRVRVADVLAFSQRRQQRQETIANMVDTMTDAGAEY